MFQGTDQVCSLRVGASVEPGVDILLVVDDSPALQPLQSRIGNELARVVDALLALERAHGEAPWFHIGAISADPADGARLHGGCGIAGDPPWVDYQRGTVSDLDPGVSVGNAVGCLAERGTAGAAAQQPMTMAARLLRTDIPENHGFRRPGALLVVIFFTGADYPEDGQPLLDARTPDLYDTVFESVASPSAHLDPVVAAAYDHVALPIDATDWSPLFSWDRPIEELPGSSCLIAPPRDPDHPDFIVEDVTAHADGRDAIVELPACTTTAWQPTCWELYADRQCASGLRFHVRRPLEGAPPDTYTRLSWDCAAD